VATVSAKVCADPVATGEPSKIAAPFSIDRHYSGALVDEAAAAAVAH
jgi:sarcosine oxidase subunit beta